MHTYLRTRRQARLDATEPHYVRCIKPNDGMAAFGFDQTRVLKQLSYSGVLDVIRIRRQGFPSRMPFGEFEAKYGALLLHFTAFLVLWCARLDGGAGAGGVPDACIRDLPRSFWLCVA